MDAFVSGVAARIVFLEGNDISYIEADEPDVTIQSSIAALPHLLAGAYDIEKLEGVDKGTALKSLLTKWNQDRALRMLQFSLDPEISAEIRIESAYYLSEFLQDNELSATVRNWSYAIPLFSKVDSSEIKKTFNKFPAVIELIDALIHHQDAIVRSRQAWDAIRDSHFNDTAERKHFELAAIHTGAFRKLSQVIDKPEEFNTVLLECHKALSAEPNYRTVLREWTKDFVTKLPKKQFRQTENDHSENGHGTRDRKPERFRQHGQVHEKYQAALLQQEGIRERLQKGDVSRARMYTEQLVKWQLENGGPEFAAKSLCSLAQDAKSLGQHSLQLEWVRRATQVAPDDGWAYGQAGDAYMALYRFDEARKCYEHAIKLGDEQFGATGIGRLLRASGKLDEALEAFGRAKDEYPAHPEAVRAWAGYSEVLRDMWRLEEALESYEKAAATFPDSDLVLCGQAAVLKDLGDLDKAIAIYDTAIKRFPDSAVAYGGRADVLKTMGELDDALTAYEEGIELFPTEPILRAGKADVLRAIGRFDDALDVYSGVRLNFPHEPAAYSGYAEVLRDRGNLEDALQAYDEAVERFTFEVRCRNGRANILRVAGKYEDALQAYDKNVRDFPYNLYSLSGRANLLKELGHYTDALAAYDVIIERRPDYANARYSKAAILVILEKFGEAEALLPNSRPRTSSEWVAFHIKGMIQLKQKRFEEALDIFTQGILLNPFFKERIYFENALAATKIRLRQFEEAKKIARHAGDAISNILLLHTCCELKHIDKAKEAYANINDNFAPPIILLRDELAAQYQLINRKPTHTEDWVLEQEMEILLQAA